MTNQGLEMMNCSKCISPMEMVEFGGVQVERCMDCHGLFFGDLEKEKLMNLRGAEAIDTGEAEVGREFNKVDCINCPRCGSRMIRMVDAEQPHIWFEHCTVCSGSFFDAGEFRDLRHHTIVDFFKDLMGKARE